MSQKLLISLVIFGVLALVLLFMFFYLIKDDIRRNDVETGGSYLVLALIVLLFIGLPLFMLLTSQ